MTTEKLVGDMNERINNNGEGFPAVHDCTFFFSFCFLGIRERIYAFLAACHVGNIFFFGKSMYQVSYFKIKVTWVSKN